MLMDKVQIENLTKGVQKTACLTIAEVIRNRVPSMIEKNRMAKISITVEMEVEGNNVVFGGNITSLSQEKHKDDLIGGVADNHPELPFDKATEVEVKVSEPLQLEGGSIDDAETVTETETPEGVQRTNTLDDDLPPAPPPLDD